MEAQIQRVRELRNTVAELQAQRAKLENEFHLANDELFVDLATAKKECDEAEQVLRDMTIKAYEETGNKAPAVGVGTRVVTKLLYDVGKAFEWAKQHGLALKLDTAAFEKIAKADKPDFVAVEESPQATIATDLNKENV